MERNRMNAILDVRESDAQLRAQVERSQIERILLNEGDAVNNSVLVLTSQGNILPTASSPHVAFSVQNYPSPHVSTSPGGHAMTTITESRPQNPLNNVQLPSQTAHGQPGSFPTRPLPRGGNYVALPSFAMTPSFPSIPQPPGNIRGIGRPQAITTLTSSIPASARPVSSTLQSHLPSAATAQGPTIPDTVSLVENMLKQFQVDMQKRDRERDQERNQELLTQVSKMMEYRSSPGVLVSHMSPSSLHHLRRNESDHEQTSPHFRGSSPPYPPHFEGKDSIKMSKARI